MVNPFLLAATSAGVVLTGWVTYLARIPGGNVPLKPFGTLAVEAAGVLAAGGAIGWAVQSKSLSAGVVAPSAFALTMGLMFLWLYTQRRTPAGDLQVQVGDPMLAFDSTDQDGTPFHSDSLRGKRVLLKFFRGSW